MTAEDSIEKLPISKKCPRCANECSNEAIVCGSCSFSFSKTRRAWKRTVNIASTVSLFIGLLVVVINQSTQIFDRLRPTEFVFLGIGSATGTNRLITDNFTLGIKSGGSIMLEKLQFYGSDKYSSQLHMDILVGRGFKSKDIASIKINPTAIHLSYQPASREILESFIDAGVQPEDLSFFFKIRPTSTENSFYLNNPKSSIPGIAKVSYFEINNESQKRQFKEYPVTLLIWVRKFENLGAVFEQKDFPHVDQEKLLKDYAELINKLTE
ncbi:hypothetical protein SAMN04488029_3156 [Reichenbachiella faecimaris]|uniref:Uncharacterized protein n=1 Tax=Reichenbachiella faecimaris TaxID=692418 RepID=A0A1W2GKZ6_REIFA|nr:hypothetical protein [Reichenbachiella faecimaris]SMD36946.1 hypothetical protein SAMN04488029_3156 [Reichenbachiella faecimaris]